MRIPIPKDEPEELKMNLQHRDPSFITWYIDVKPWKCLECKTTMFGRCKHCVYCALRYSKIVPRPSSFVERPRNE